MLLPGFPQVRLPLVALLAAACVAGPVHAPAHAEEAPPTTTAHCDGSCRN